MKIIWLFVIIPGFVICLDACTSGKSAGAHQERSDQLYTYRWELAELYGKTVHKTDQMDPHLFFHSEDGKVTGSPGCNRLAGSFSISGDQKIEFTTTVTTKMTCPDTKMEYRFMEALGRAETWLIVDGMLQLMAEQKVIAQFKGVSADRRTR